MELSQITILKDEVVLMNEAWLTSDSPNSTIVNEYTIFCRDRPTPGGGVLAYEHQSIPVTRLMTVEEDNKNVLWLMLKRLRTRAHSALSLLLLYTILLVKILRVELT